jgi:hypothetical protein
MKKYRIHFSPVLCAVLLTACTTAFYDGPERPDNEVATIKSRNTYITTIDGKEATGIGGNEAKYKISPGRHTLAVALNNGSDDIIRRTSKVVKTVTFNAEAGQTYTTYSVLVPGNWKEWKLGVWRGSSVFIPAQ